MITCGGCGTNAIVSPDTTYERTVILDENDISDPIHVTITVIKCSNKKCEQKYHALLPDWICPFLPYTYEFIAKVMDYFYNEANENIQKTAKFFQLNRKTVRRFRVLVEGLGVELRMTELFQTLEFSLALLFQNLADKKNWAEAARFRKSFVERCGRAFMAVKTTYLHNHKVYTYTYTPIGV